MNPEKHLRAVFIGIGLFIILAGFGIFIWGTMDTAEHMGLQDELMKMAGEKESTKPVVTEVELPVEETVEMELDEIDEIFSEIDALTTDEDLSDLEL